MQRYRIFKFIWRFSTPKTNSENLVDPASSHMLLSRTEAMQVSEQTRWKLDFLRNGLRTAHYTSNYPLGVVGMGLKHCFWTTRTPQNRDIRPNWSANTWTKWILLFLPFSFEYLEIFAKNNLLFLAKFPPKKVQDSETRWSATGRNEDPRPAEGQLWNDDSGQAFGKTVVR